MRYSMHDADQAFVAALEDAGYGTSSPDASLFALDSDHPEESTLLFDTTLSGDDLENIFTGAKQATNTFTFTFKVVYLNIQ